MEMLKVRATFRLAQLFGALGKAEMENKSLQHLPMAWDGAIVADGEPVCSLWDAGAVITSLLSESLHDLQVFTHLLLLVSFWQGWSSSICLQSTSQQGSLVLVGLFAGTTVLSGVWKRCTLSQKAKSQRGSLTPNLTFQVTLSSPVVPKGVVCHQITVHSPCAFNHGASIRMPSSEFIPLHTGTPEFMKPFCLLPLISTTTKHSHSLLPLVSEHFEK